MTPKIDALRRFVRDFAALLEHTEVEAEILEEGGYLLERLVANDDWLPAAYAEPDPDRYRQFLLHCDSLERFSVVSFVWGPGQETPIHNHTVWGLVGMLRGAETNRAYLRGPDGLVAGAHQVLRAGQVEAVSPRIGDIHQVANADPDRTSISIHVYGGNIGAVERATFDVTGQTKLFISGYANATLPNLWDRSRNPVAAAAG